MSFAAFDEAPNGTDPFAASEDADPAADFLARQQNQLADLESDAPFAQQPQQQEQPFGTTNDTNNSYDDASPANGISAEYADSQSVPQNGGTSTSDPYGAIHREDRLQQEPEKIKRWREAFAERITEKDVAEDKKGIELHETAAKELVDWQRHYDEQLERQRASNREAEVAFIKQRDETGPGSEWERVCWLCDFNPKTSKQVKDVSRMRSLLLQLKQQQQTPTQ